MLFTIAPDITRVRARGTERSPLPSLAGDRVVFAPKMLSMIGLSHPSELGVLMAGILY